LQKHGGNHNASTASNLTAYYLEVENGALKAATDRLASALAEPLLDPKMPIENVMQSMQN